MTPFTASSPVAVKQATSWVVRAGLATSGCVSLESVAVPGSFLRRSGAQVVLSPQETGSAFAVDATFCPSRSYDSGLGLSLLADGSSSQFLYRAADGTVRIGPLDGTAARNAAVTFSVWQGTA